MKEILCLCTLLSLPFVQCGFTSGAPCHVHNTALLNPKRPIWPRDPVHCVDMTNLGITPLALYVQEIRNATTIFAGDMLMSRLPAKAMKLMSNLELLDASNNKLRKIDRYTFAKNPHFSTLLLNDNRILLPRRIPFLTSKSLTTLYLSNNGIKRAYPASFVELPSLKVLFLDGNLLTKINPKVFRPLKNLKYLHLGNNQLKMVPPKMSLSRGLVVYITKGNPGDRKDKMKPIK